MILTAFYIAMICQAVNVLFWEGHIFEKPGNWAETHYPNLWKPVAGCVICMTPWWGVLMCLIFDWPFLSVPVAMGINVVTVRWEPKD